LKRLNLQLTKFGFPEIKKASNASRLRAQLEKDGIAKSLYLCFCGIDGFFSNWECIFIETLKLNKHAFNKLVRNEASTPKHSLKF
jgi:hypothetical protein